MLPVLVGMTLLTTRHAKWVDHKARFCAANCGEEVFRLPPRQFVLKPAVPCALNFISEHL